MRKLKWASLSAAIILSLSGCDTMSEKVELPLPPPLTYPSITAEELQCLSDKTYEALVVRDTMCRTRVETLEDIIRSTH